LQQSDPCVQAWPIAVQHALFTQARPLQQSGDVLQL
jgi:hypothetical protein